PEVRCLVTARQRPADHSAGDADGVLLAYLAVVVGEDVGGVGVHTDDVARLDVEPSLLAHFSHDCFGDRLAEFHHSAGQGPQVVVGATVEHDAALVVGHNGGRGGYERVRCRGRRVVVVVDS